MQAEEAFGIVLRQIRVGRSFSQQELAFRGNLDRTYVSLLERGLRQPSLSTLFSLSKALEVEPDFIVRRVDELIHENSTTKNLDC